MRMHTRCICYGGHVLLADDSVIPDVSRNVLLQRHATYDYLSEDLSFWLRMTVSFLLPTVAIIYCNSMIVHTVKNHIQNTVLGKRVTRTYRRAKILPMVTVASFVCCWTPWIVSVLYFRSHRHCNVATVLNICTGVGHLYCLSNPVLYIFVKRRSNGTLRAMSKSTSF